MEFKQGRNIIDKEVTPLRDHLGSATQGRQPIARLLSTRLLSTRLLSTRLLSTRLLTTEICPPCFKNYVPSYVQTCNMYCSFIYT